MKLKVLFKRLEKCFGNFEGLKFSNDKKKWKLTKYLF